MQLEKYMKNYKAELPRNQKLYNYYIGKHDILSRVLPDKTKSNNKLVANYPHYIVSQATGFMISTPIAYLSTENDKEYLDDLERIFFINDEEDVNAEIVKNMVIYGKSYEVLWIDREAQTRFTQYSPLEMHVEIDDRDNILCAFKPYTVEDAEGTKTEFVEVYDSDGIRYFKKVGGTYQEQIDKFKPHHFNEIPVIIHKNNDEQLGDFEMWISLIDGINKLLSDSQNEIEAFSNAFLSITNAQGTTDEDITRMKQDGVLLLPPDAKAEWLIKNINSQYQNDHFEKLDDLIHTQSATPKLTSEQFASNLSGTAIKTKLQGLINKTATRERKLGKSLRKRIRLVTKILNLKGKDYDPYTIRFQFSRNIPSNENDITDQIVKLQNLIDRETLLSWHPKIENAAQVIEKYKEEQPDINLDEMFNDINKQLEAPRDNNNE